MRSLRCHSRSPSGTSLAAEPGHSLFSATRREKIPNFHMGNFRKKCKKKKTTLKPALEKLAHAHIFLLNNSREEDLLEKKASQGLPWGEWEMGWLGWLTARRGGLLPAAAGRAGASPPCSGRRR